MPVEQRLAQVDLASLRQARFTPSPTAWEDQVLYFLLLDRFSDGNEQGYRDVSGNVVQTGHTPLFKASDAGNAITTEQDASAWRDAGATWQGGTLKGLHSKLGYLKRLGITAIWISPVFKQVTFQPTYHGYGIQNYVDVDPHFGTREDLRDLVRAAHDLGICVILDIILNHSGNVFTYNPDRYVEHDQQGHAYLDPRWDDHLYEVRGWNDHAGVPRIPYGPIDLGAFPDAWPDGGVWPAEFQRPETFTRKGHLNNWDYDPEYLQGDFFDLKDVTHGQGSLDAYAPSQALIDLCTVYRFWIAYADLDGYRVDTVKHMDPGASRFFASAMHEFAQSIGKDRFYLIAEHTGGRDAAYVSLELTGLDAALGIAETNDRLKETVKGTGDPNAYFVLFRNSELVQKGSHTWFRDKVVTTFDDHDNVSQGDAKHRFCAGEPRFRKLALAVIALNALTLGIPCIYYGTEQEFDGAGGSDRYIREAMFGGEFGPFRSRHVHCFDESGFVYQETAKVLDLRRRTPALRRGRQYLRPISGDGQHFGLPTGFGGVLKSIVPWSRILDTTEVLGAINTDTDAAQTAWVTVDAGLHNPGDDLRCLYSSDPAQIGRTVKVEARGGCAVQLTVPPAGVAVYG